MLVVDANVLLDAVNTDSRQHDVARHWLEHHLNGAETVGFAWVVLLAFLRVGTRAGLLPLPMSVEEGLDHVDAWLAQPPSVVLQPTPRHARILRGMLGDLGTGGNLTSDAHVAALALEHRGTVVSFDADFARFEGVPWRSPADFSL